jgi:tRNA modification GTPase
MLERERDTIFAPASGVGRAAIAVLRISGPGCSSALEAIAPGGEFPDRRAILVTLRRPHSGEPLDRALVTRFRAPRSFTGEEMAEVSVTGGRAVTAAVVKALALVPGLRLAEPGEFAWRAFVNGKIDLSEVEGLADLVAAETEAQRRQAQRIAGGALSRECDAIRASLIEAMAAVEAQIDFSDVEDADGLTLETVKRAARAAIERIDRALTTADAAGRLREGFTVVIAGPPNVGKSTLMNALAGCEVAITSPIAGTTRDLIEVFLDLRGYPVTLVDTAGIRDSADPVEQEGVARARRRAGSADLTLWLEDGVGGELPRVGSPVLTVRTKIDLLGIREPAAEPPPPLARRVTGVLPNALRWGREGVGGRADHRTPRVAPDADLMHQETRDGSATPLPNLPHKGGGGRSLAKGEELRPTSIQSQLASESGAPPPAAAEFAISAKTGAGVDRLLDALADLAEERMSSREPALLTLERHRQAFQDARETLAATVAPDAAEWELIAEDLRRAAAAMDRIVGRIGAEDVLGEIFARLCVGK